MFDAAVWGTVGQWVSGVASSGALLVGASVLGIDLYRKRRAQASSIIAWYRPTAEGVKISVQNLSDQPIFNYGMVAQVKSASDLKKVYATYGKLTLSKGPDLPRDPPNSTDDFHIQLMHEVVDDEPDFVLAPGRSSHLKDKLEYSRRVYEFYIFFTDAYGRRWVRDARTNKLVGRRARVRVHPNESWMKTVFLDE
jgi:hypothetical protein